MSKRAKDLTIGDVNTQLKNLTIPMIFGMLGIVAFNMADTYFVGKLGTVQMAALTFTFPVVLVLNSINFGIGIGTGSVISRAVGAKQTEKVKILATHSLTLGILFSIIALTIGELTIVPLFTSLGADETVLPYIISYMRIWYAGAPFIVIPMVGNNAIRALGDSKTPSIVMMVSAATNIILDPIFIFVLNMGVTGAAVATVISRTLTFFFALYVLAIREKVISIRYYTYHEVINTWKEILIIGLPNAISKIIIPVGAGIITGLIATFGTKAVAGFGIATRVEFLMLSVLGSLASVTPAYVGQNFGAKKISRIKKGLRSSEQFSIIYGLFLIVAMMVFGRPISYIFTKDPEVSNIVVSYLRIVPLGYMSYGIIQVITNVFNALHHPIKGATLNLIQMLIIYVPLAKILSIRFGPSGIFISLTISYTLVAIGSHIAIRRTLKTYEHLETDANKA